ncbi:MAG: molecular chaperone TorD family protein [Chloroflexi bacterium]|nr:molecular chaperone TorD family protein [Chloroflexota bacterium]
MRLQRLALGHHHSYRLLGRLYLDGLTAVLHPFVQQIPQLSSALASYDEDETASAHHHLFAFNIFPYEALFLGNDGLLGGDVTQAVTLAYHDAGYVVDTAVSSPDHLGCQLDFLAFLAAAEADAWEDELIQVAEHLRTMQQTFLQTHLLRWSIPCLLAIQEQGEPFFAQLAALTLALILAHHDELAKTAVSPQNFLPPTKNILARDKTGFKEIVRHLLTPAFSGIYLSRHTIGQLARQLELPRGFGNRDQMLMNLLQTAVQYDALPNLLTNLESMCQAWQKKYQQIQTNHPKSAPIIAQWQEHTQATSHLLIQMQASQPNP